MIGSTSRATNGKVTKVVARMMPGTAKMMWMSCASSQGPRMPRAPSSSTNTRPEITGDTENGRSISVISALLPGKRYFEISHEAVTPKTTFSGTETSAVNTVSRIAARVSGSEIASV